ncbi:MAG TPA: DUF2993 domain-containing protein [Jatrophihabitantaceae bacterium]|nr:DUF2993 domain-containing protein [Jatrophihabitantaceae bacterium]
MRRLLIGVIVLVGLLVAADRVGNVIAEHTVAKTVQDSQHLAHRPDVDIAGFPFLTQLAAGKFGKVTLHDHDVTTGTGRRALHLSAVTVVLRDVAVSRDFSSATAAHTTANALVSYADLSSALGVSVSYAGNGRVRAKASTSVLGRAVNGSVTARPEVRSGDLAFGSAHVSVDGAQLPASASAALADVFGAPLSFAGLPYGLSVRSVAASADGLRLVLAARNLTFRR